MRPITRKSLLALAVPTALAVVLLMFVAPPKVEAGRQITCTYWDVNGAWTVKEPATHAELLELCASIAGSTDPRERCVDRQGHDVCK